MLDEEDEYEFSECAEKAIRFFYPDTLKPNQPMFSRHMKELQLRLIECKLPFMHIADKRRALQTIRFLKSELSKA